MKTASEIVGKKWEELAKRRSTQNSFSHVERMIWFIIILRVDMEMEGFFTIFADSMTYAELLETISYIKELGLPDIATLLEEAIELLRVNSIYDANWEIIQWELPESVDTDLFTISKKIWEGRALWQLDEKLATLLQQETDAQ